MLSEVIGFQERTARIMPFHHAHGLAPDATIIGLRRQHRVPFGKKLLGRVLNGLGEPIDGKGPLGPLNRKEMLRAAPPAVERPRIEAPFVTGQKVIDSLLTLGIGQRAGLFAGSGVGKSTLLGEIARGAQSDLNVIALIGERGREVRPFLDDYLGAEGCARSVIVVSTSDQTPLMRVRAAQTAITIADGFRSQGAKVLLLLDSLTRLAMAQREIGLLLGEPPSSRGYTPSVFYLLANLLEQLGNTPDGSVTGILTVLVDGDDMDEPISDAVRGILDGHLVLDRSLAEKGHYPAIAVNRSLSRVFRDVTTKEHQAAAQKIRSILATWQEVADLVRIGAYAKGSSPRVDRALMLLPKVEQFLMQRAGSFSSFQDTRKQMEEIAAAWPF